MARDTGSLGPKVMGEYDTREFNVDGKDTCWMGIPGENRQAQTIAKAK